MKRIKKVVFIIVILGLCSGCTIKYNLEIRQNEVSENIMVSDSIVDGRTSEDIIDDYNYWIPVYNDINDPDLIMDGDDAGSKVNGVEYHEKTITQISNGYEHTYKYTYPIGRFNHANSLRLAYGNPNFYDGGSYINIRTNNENGLCNYSYFETMQVNIKVDLKVYKVKQSNAHSVNGNTYTWNLDRDNCDKSIISLTLDKINNNAGNKTNSTNVVTSASGRGTTGASNYQDNSSFTNYGLYILLVIIILVVIIGYVWFNKMKNRSNIMDD